MGVILYQEQVMKIAIDVAGFSAAESDGFRRAMGTWRSSKEMEKLHKHFVDGCIEGNGLTTDQAEELFRQVAAFASFGFNKSHAAAFARTAYESAFLKLFYPAQFVTGLINAQPMGFYPVEVLINDAKRHGVCVLPVDINKSRLRTTTEWVGMPDEPLPDDASDQEIQSGTSGRNQDCQSAAVLEAVMSLSETYRETLILRLVEGMTGPEIAARTGMTQGSVRVNLHRGMEQLRAKLSAGPSRVGPEQEKS